MTNFTDADASAEGQNSSSDTSTDSASRGGSRFATTRDGRRLHYVVRGAGSPTVVLESGLGAPHRAWDLVVPALSDFATVIAYDRAGLGRSDRDHSPRTLQRIVDDLNDLLNHDELNGPYILVGHSLGGPIVRLLAHRHPELVAGLVLVDQAAEEADWYQRRPVRFSGAATYRIGALLARLSLLEPLMKSGLLLHEVERVVRKYPEETRADIRHEIVRLETIRTSLAEWHSLSIGLRDLNAVRTRSALPDVPVSVISGVLTTRGDRKIRSEITTFHKDLAASLPQGRHVSAERSGHMVPHDQPDLIAQEVRSVIESIRRS